MSDKMRPIPFKDLMNWVYVNMKATGLFSA